MIFTYKIYSFFFAAISFYRISRAGQSFVNNYFILSHFPQIIKKCKIISEIGRGAGRIKDTKQKTQSKRTNNRPRRRREKFYVSLLIAAFRLRKINNETFVIICAAKMSDKQADEQELYKSNGKGTSLPTSTSTKSTFAIASSPYKHKVNFSKLYDFNAEDTKRLTHKARPAGTQ